MTQGGIGASTDGQNDFFEEIGPKPSKASLRSFQKLRPRRQRVVRSKVNGLSPLDWLGYFCRVETKKYTHSPLKSGFLARAAATLVFSQSR